MSTVDESYYLASQWQLMWRKFRKHRLAVGGGTVLALCYLVGLFCVSLAPYDVGRRFPEHIYAPPVRVHFVDAGGRFHLRPFVYGMVKEVHPETWLSIYTEDTSVRFPLRFFVRGDPYRFWGVLRTDVRLFGVEEPGLLFLFGTDDLGRDLFSRVLYATRISLSISLVGVLLSFVIGCVLGGISGYYGGSVDMAVQRVIEFILSLPTIPLWLALAAALPAQWKPLQVYFGISIVLSAVGWTRLARVVRGKFLELPRGRLRARRQGGRRQRPAHHRRPPDPVVPELPDREPDPGGAQHDPGRDRAQLPRRRPALAGGELGRADAGGAERADHCPLSLVMIPGGFVGDGAGVQLPRRRPARRRRPVQIGAARRAHCCAATAAVVDHSHDLPNTGGTS